MSTEEPKKEIAPLIVPGKVTGGSVKMFEEFLTDEEIRKVIQKYALGTEIWFQRIWGNAQMPVINPATGQPAGMMNIPVTQLFLGMKGFLLGPENYIWWLVNLDAIPTAEKLDKHIMEALESMRSRKAQQMNNGSPRRKK